MNERIGIIGFGNMGSVIAERLKTKYRIWAFDKDKTKTKTLSSINAADNIADLTNKVDIVLLAVKPQDFDAVLKEIKKHVRQKLIISIAAGISTKYIEKVLGNTRVVRAMPNICARIGESVTCLSKGTFASEEDLDFAQELFYHLGVTKIIDEKMMNAATAISGSGPAYIFDLFEANSIDANNIPEYTRNDITQHLEIAAAAVGFESEDARFLATATANASITLIRKTNLSPAELKKQVASKGGTTEAALKILEKGGSWEEAAQAALKRAQELSKKE